MLYVVNKSPLMTHNLESCLSVAPPGEPILLIEDGVYGVLDGAGAAGSIVDALQQHAIYALDADLEARGIRRVVEGVQVIGYDGFVGLVEEHHIVPWL
jgi:tRNA 2-thiouridine synthesizing protein B